jgi:hypothetical protein
MPIPNPEDIDHPGGGADATPALTRTDPLQLWTILDYAVLHRSVSGDTVMLDQLKWLVEADKAANIQVQVIAFSAGAHAGMPGSFAVMDFPDPQDPDLGLQRLHSG